MRWSTPTGTRSAKQRQRCCKPLDPYNKPVINAQHELSKLPIYQRVYQTLRTKALSVLPADLNLRDRVGPTFDNVFVAGNDENW